MSFQLARRDLCSAIENIVGSAGWRVTTETAPDLYHQTIVVGHADQIIPDSFGGYKAELRVTVWVSEADDDEAADLLYELISPGPDFLLDALITAPEVAGRNLTARVAEVGRRDMGPSGFLAADIEISLMSDAPGGWQ